MHGPPTICGRVDVQYRFGIGTAATCPFWNNFNDGSDVSVYRHRHDVHTLEHGSFWEDWVYSDALRINGGGTCEYPAYTTNYNPPTDYGALLSTEYTFDDAVDPASVASAAEAHVVWEEWSDFVPFEYPSKSSIFFAALEEGNFGFPSVTAFKSGPSEPGYSDWSISAGFCRAQMLFRLMLPLAVQVVCETGVKAPEDDHYTWTEDAPLVLTPDAPEQTITVEPAAPDVFVLKRIKRLIFHPLT